MPAKKHILVIRLSAMGDVAMTVPVLRALVLQHPNIKVTVASRPQFKPMFDGLPNLTFFPVDTRKIYKGIFGIWKLYKELKKLHFYAVADLHNVLRSAIVTRLFKNAGKKTASLDKARAAKRALTSSTNKVFAPLPPVTQKYAEVFAQLGFTIDLTTPVFPEKPALTPDIIELMQAPKAGAWIGVAPFARHEGKVYPADLMKKVIEGLAKDPAVIIVLFGAGKTELAKLKRYSKDLPNVVVAAGKLNFKQELRLIAHLDVMLSMDSGNGHMAAMYGVSTVTLWGATHPYAGFAPYHQDASNALTADRDQYPQLPTSVYGNKKIKGYEDAMRTIPPERVIQKIQELLNNKAGN
jgi:ADP-heptose:LPS heptosyltransferase